MHVFLNNSLRETDKYSYNKTESERLTGKRCRMRSLSTISLSGANACWSTKSALHSSGSPARNELSLSMNSAAADKARTNHLLAEIFSYSFIMCIFACIPHEEVLVRPTKQITSQLNQA